MISILREGERQREREKEQKKNKSILGMKKANLDC
jgi:hypothetical protein